MNAYPRILIVGGSGAFGSRLVRELAQRGGFDIILAGRNAAKAAPLVAELRAKGTGASFLELDRERPDMARIRTAGVLVVVDAAGPFQNSSLALVEAAIEAGVHYVDLADARDFVRRVSSLDDKARRHEVTILAGASSTPALSHAVLDEFTTGWASLDHILVAISPGNRAPLGRSVMEAVLSYAGKPVRVFRESVWQEAPGWGLNQKIELPGMGRRNVCLCDTPDLDLMVDRYRPRIAAEFKAGLELGLLHHALRLVALPVRWRWAGTLKPLAPILRFIAGWFRPFGTDQGGMVVEVIGRNGDGKACKLRWLLGARAGVGPTVPVLPALSVIEGLVKGTLTFRGAGSAAGSVRYADLARHLERLGCEIRTEYEELSLPQVFQSALGSDWGKLPHVTREIHQPCPSIVLEGRAEVEGASTRAGRIVSTLFGFPTGGQDLPVRVAILREAQGERWARIYPTRTMRSFLAAPDLACGTLNEHFGCLGFRLKVKGHEQGLDLVPEKAVIGRTALPSWFLPQVAATERVSADGRHLFDVSITLEPFGRLVHYRGWLEPVSEARAQ
jgi:hypothetical protein